METSIKKLTKDCSTLKEQLSVSKALKTVSMMGLTNLVTLNISPAYISIAIKMMMKSWPKERETAFQKIWGQNSTFIISEGKRSIQPIHELHRATNHLSDTGQLLTLILNGVVEQVSSRLTRFGNSNGHHGIGIS